MLNDAKIRAAKPRAKPFKLTDSSRLYLLVTPGGSKMWKWSSSYNHKQRTLHLGVYPKVGLAGARAQRDEAAAIHSEGRDPGVVRRLIVEANLEAGRQTFERLAREWFDNARPKWALVHADDVIRSLDRDVFPAIGGLPISEINAPLVLAVLREIESRGAIETAKRVRQRISGVFVFAIAKGLTQHDPAEKLGAVLKPLRKGRQPAITDLVPLRAMIVAAEEDYARPITRLALRFLALTAVRPSELRGARWDEFEELNGAGPLWRMSVAQRRHGKPAAARTGDSGRTARRAARQAVRTITDKWTAAG